MGQFSVVSTEQRGDVTITVLKNDVEKRFVRVETRKGGPGDGPGGMPGTVCMYVYIYILCPECSVCNVCMYVYEFMSGMCVYILCSVCMYVCMYMPFF